MSLPLCNFKADTPTTSALYCVCQSDCNVGWCSPWTSAAVDKGWQLEVVPGGLFLCLSVSILCAVFERKRASSVPVTTTVRLF